jgi:hypothetical protein
MSTYHDHGDHVHEEPVRPVESGGGFAAYAFVKYAFILAITIVILWFLARYILPMIPR